MPNGFMRRWLVMAAIWAAGAVLLSLMAATLVLLSHVFAWGLNWVAQKYGGQGVVAVIVLVMVLVVAVGSAIHARLAGSLNVPTSRRPP